MKRVLSLALAIALAGSMYAADTPQESAGGAAQSPRKEGRRSGGFNSTQ